MSIARFLLVGIVVGPVCACASGPVEGTCKVGMWIEADGTITDPKIAESSGSPKIDAACLNSVRGQKLNPGTENGVPVRMHTILSVIGHVKDGNSSPGVFMNGPMVPPKSP